MNWKEVIKKNEKAFKLLTKWIIPEYTNEEYQVMGSENGDIHISLYNNKGELDGAAFSVYLRDLYDFFDDNEIPINVYYKVYTFAYSIALAEEDFKDNGVYGSRKEAEKAAFTKTFEILEQKLNK